MPQVIAISKGFCVGRRRVGEVFDGPVDAEGKLLKGSWYKLYEPKAAKVEDPVVKSDRPVRNLPGKLTAKAAAPKGDGKDLV